MSGFPRKTLEPAAVRRKPSLTGLTSGCQQMAGLYDLEETLGKGHFAVVKAARHVFTGEKVAVKVIDKSKLDAAHQKSLLKEVLCMKLVQHPHVVRLYEVIDTSTKLYLVLELGHGDLYDLIQRQQGGLSEDLSRKYFCQILSAVSFCHKLHVVHRDLKPENVVFFPNLDGGQVKLTDFGFSNNYSPGVKLATSCGSLAYSAPEILLGDPYDPAAIDIWSLGVILYMLVAGRAPFQEANDSETLTMIMDVKYSIPPHVTSVSCRELIRSMLVRGPENRASLDQIERSKWIQEGGNYKILTSQKKPLIVDHRLTPEEKNKIIGQMEAGHIATREQIREALELNAYNHITSTFYLLAERHLRERNTFPGTPSALTSSLESLHERRKSSGGGHSHSGTSDTDDGLPSETEDSLAPLDLEMKNASPSTSLAVKKSGRIHTALSSSALSDLDKGLQLPVLEENEDSVGSREEDDNAGPLPPSSLPSSTSHHRRRAPYHHRRVIIPQRSASCSSSEDEDSEKKKRANRNKIKVKHVSECVTKKIFDDESSDEQGNGTGAGSLGLGLSLAGGSSSTTGGNNGGSSHGGHSEITYSPPHGSSGPCESFITITPADDDDGGEDCDCDGEEGVPESSNHLRLSTSYKNGYTSDPDRHSCSDLAYAIEVTEDNDPRPREHPPTALSLAKKGKKFFFSWFFLKKKNKGRTEAEVNSPSTSVGIYKTKSFAELKLRSSSAVVGSNKTNPNSMDVNMNL